MIAHTISCSVRGIAGVPVDVEADIYAGLPSVTIVGLTDRAIQESRERVRSAIRNAGYKFPDHRLTVNLAPAEVPKEGTGFDLAIAAAVLRASGMDLQLRGIALLGELGLDGEVRPITGVLPMVRCLKSHGVGQVVVPEANASEAALVRGIDIIAVRSLQRCVEHLDGSALIPPWSGARVAPASDIPVVDLEAVRGQSLARRALEIAAAGGHNLLMVGPPGSGKTLLARSFPSILPDLSEADGLEVAAIYSLRGAFRDRLPESLRPPFRAPHHSVSRAGLIGGGPGLAQPGEISLAHHGVLFLDELCEFPRQQIEALRQPLEERVIAISRVRGAVTLPADITLLAAANPCPCGYFGDPRRPCTCSVGQLNGYRGRLSGPLRDRIDLVIDVPRQHYADIFDAQPAESSAMIRARVERSREHQASRHHRLNAHLDGRPLLEACAASEGAMNLLARAGEQLNLSARAFYRVLRVARSIADLDGDVAVNAPAVAEALRFRQDGHLLGAAA